MEVKEIAVDVRTSQEIAGREGIAWESCISKVLLFSILYGLGINFSSGPRSDTGLACCSVVFGRLC